MSYIGTKSVDVRIWGRPVAALAEDPTTGLVALEYEPDWLASGCELSPLQMPRRRGVFVSDLPKSTYSRLPAFIADALPDEFGNRIVTAWLSRRGYAADQITALDRLAYLADRAFGALEFSPSKSPRVKPPSILDASTLVAAARDLLSGEFGSDVEAKAALKQLLHVGTSAGGQRAKAAIAFNPDTGLFAAGNVLPDGYRPWLIKLDGVRASSKGGHSETESGHFGRVEYAYHTMALQAGLMMSPCRLLEHDGLAHFMTERFDRRPAAAGQLDKIHIQSLCAMAHMDYRQIATHDYSQAFQALAALDRLSADGPDLFRRMAFNVMAKNCDDHTKNIAFWMHPEDRRWSLAPAYDMVFSYSPTSHWVSQHLMSVNGRFKEIERADLMAVADRFGILSAGQILEQVAEAVDAWPKHAENAGMPDALTKEISAHLQPDLAFKSSSRPKKSPRP